MFILQTLDFVGIKFISMSIMMLCTCETVTRQKLTFNGQYLPPIKTATEQETEIKPTRTESHNYVSHNYVSM